MPKFAGWQVGSDFGQNLTCERWDEELAQKRQVSWRKPTGLGNDFTTSMLLRQLHGNLQEISSKVPNPKKLILSTKFSPNNWFLAPKSYFPTPCFNFRAPASRCTKNGPDPPLHQVCTSREESCTNTPPPVHQNWPHVWSQPGAGQAKMCELR